jgi:hypothetical protein
MGIYDLNDIPGFKALYQEVQEHNFDIVYVDLDELAPPALTPDYESEFVRSLLEASGVLVLNAFTDDKEAFSRELTSRCGENARAHEVTDSSDIVNFFPSLAGEITASALSRELERSKDEELSTVVRRIDTLRANEERFELLSWNNNDEQCGTLSWRFKLRRWRCPRTYHLL